VNLYALEDTLKKTLNEGKDLVEVVAKSETKSKRLNVFATIIDETAPIKEDNHSAKEDDG
jgi:hypothetical protein